MLAYFEALCNALKARDASAIAALLKHPLASALPPLVVDEAQRIAAAGEAGSLAPLHALRLFHQTAHLLGACSDPATRRRASGAPHGVSEVPRQMELDLRHRVAVS